MTSPAPSTPRQPADPGHVQQPQHPQHTNPPNATARPRAVAVVPARLGSTRLERKMLLHDSGAYLFEHTVRNAQASSALDRVVLATDSEEILQAARSVGIEALLTSTALQSGTDRVHAAFSELARAGGPPWDVVLNIQGDEPELDVSAIGLLVEAFRDPRVEMASLWAPLDAPETFADPAAVKVVIDAAGDALYFSRAPIPSRAHPGAPGAPGGPGAPGTPGTIGAKLHLGVYAFRPHALARFVALPASALAAAENLEQLRWLEAGGKIRMLRAGRASRGIDTPQDYRAFVARALETPRPRGASAQGSAQGSARPAASHPSRT